MPPFCYRLLLAAPLLSLLVLVGCSIDVGPTGPDETESRSVDLDRSELVRVQLKMGAGELSVRGGAAEAQGGIGGINARGLQKRDGRFVNDAYGHSKTTVRLDIRGGIGAINLVGG